MKYLINYMELLYTSTLLITKPFFMEVDIDSINVSGHTIAEKVCEINITINFSGHTETKFMSLIHQITNINHNKFDMYINNTQFVGCVVKSIEYFRNGNVEVNILSDAHIFTEETPAEIIALRREKTIDQLFYID